MTLKNTFVIRFYTSPPHPVGFGTTFLFSPLTTSTKLIKLTGKASLEGWGEGRKGSQGCFRMEMRQLRGSFPPLTSLCASTTALFEGANPRPGKTGGALGERPLLGRGGGTGDARLSRKAGPGGGAELRQIWANQRRGRGSAPAARSQGTPWLTVSRSQWAPRAPSGGSSAGREEASSPQHSLASWGVPAPEKGRGGEAAQLEGGR